jgi:hypothetical protein
VLLTLAAVVFGIYVLRVLGEGEPGVGGPQGAAAGTAVQADGVAAGAAPGSGAPPGMMTIDTRPSQRHR